MAFEVGDKIGDYEVIGVLGAGGMGKVYKVRNTISERVEAMKVLLPNLASNPDLEGRFLREIKLLATLDHPNIASLRTALRIENQLLMVMEFVEGTTLAQHLQQGPLPLAQTVDCICQVLSALSYAHERGVIHRDIKPANMMLTPSGVVKLMDFGIAKAAGDSKMTMTGQTLGSLSYMSPEQVKAQPLDTRSDIYSLGVSLYELVTGKRPFKEDSDYALMAAHLQKTPVAPIELDPKLPPTLNAIILMAMAKDPAARFQSAAAFRNALESVRGSLGPAPPLGAPSRAAGAPPGTATALAGSAGPPLGAAGVASAAALPRPPTQPMQQPGSTSRAGEGSTMPLAAGPPTPPRPAGPPMAPAQAPTAPSPPAPAASAGFTPDPTTQPVAARSYRGFYMTAGALVAIAVVVIGATQLPKWHRAKAGGTTPPAASETPASQAGSPAQPSSEQPGAAGGAQPAQDQPAQQSETAQPTATPGDNAGASQQAAPTPSAAVKTVRHEARAPRSSASVESKSGSQSAQASAAAQQSNSESSAPAAGAANAAKLKELRQRLTQLAARARSVKSSFDRLSAQQQAQGLGPRRDIAASVDRMSQFMDDAHDALVAGDAASAEQNMDSAQREVETLEKFFGG